MEQEAYLPFGHHTVKTIPADWTNRKPRARIDLACFTAISTHVFPPTTLALPITKWSQTLAFPHQHLPVNNLCTRNKGVSDCASCSPSTEGHKANTWNPPYALLQASLLDGKSSILSCFCARQNWCFACNTRRRLVAVSPRLSHDIVNHRAPRGLRLR